jgi:hypothetical protein
MAGEGRPTRRFGVGREYPPKPTLSDGKATAGPNITFGGKVAAGQEIIAASSGETKPQAALESDVQPAKRCIACRSSNHEESGCFLINPGLLADFLSRHQNQKEYWQGKVAEYQKRMEAKEKKHQEYLERVKVREQRHQEFLARHARREAKEREDAMTAGEKARRAQKNR